MIGAVLTGDAGHRLDPAVAPAAPLAGRPLVSYPVAALAGVCERVAVVCGADTPLPELADAERWDDPRAGERPGIVHALERAGGAVLVCGADMPFVTTDACRTLLSAAGSADGAPAVVAVADGDLEPVFGLYAPAALEALRAAPDGAALAAAVESLDPARVAFPPAIVRCVASASQLAEAQADLRAASAG
jgi:molybdopterin-guanine dinucleotide biosynthesis protein A